MEQTGVLAALAAFASGDALTIALGLAGAGTIAMATLQVLKELTPLRRRYQERWLQRWIRKRALLFQDEVRHIKELDGQLFANWEEARSCAVELITGGDARACYDMAIEDLVAQLQDVKTITISYPDRYLSLFLVLSQGASIGDIVALIGAAQQRSAKEDTTPFPIDERERVALRMERNIAGIGIALGQNWRFRMQLISLIVTIAIVEVIVAMHAGGSFYTLMVALPLGALGGYFAPVTRDLVAALERLRSPG